MLFGFMCVDNNGCRCRHKIAQQMFKLIVFAPYMLSKPKSIHPCLLS